MNFEFQYLQGQEIRKFLEDIALLRIEVFKEFPYLYEGSLAYEKTYLERYIKSEKSLILLAIHQNKVIGATTCIPACDEEEEFQKPLSNAGVDISRSFYFGESIILKEYRGHKLGHFFFKEREAHALKSLADLKTTCFCSVIRKDSPHQPRDYKSLDSFWSRMGYQKKEKMIAKYLWKDIDKDKEDEKSLVYWLKDWCTLRD